MHTYAMRTTIDISDTLLRQAKKLAAEERSSLRELVEAGLRLVLLSKRGERGKNGNGKKPRLPVCDAGELLPGVNLNDTSALLELE